MRNWFSVFLALFFVLQSGAVTFAAVPAGRISHLRHGVNVTGWLAQIDGTVLTKEHYETRITDVDLDLIASLGFDHVRLCVDPRLVGAESPGGTVDFRYLDVAVKKILDRGLAVVIDMHPDTALEKSLLKTARRSGDSLNSGALSRGIFHR